MLGSCPALVNFGLSACSQPFPAGGHVQEIFEGQLVLFFWIFACVQSGLFNDREKVFFYTA